MTVGFDIKLTPIEIPDFLNKSGILRCCTILNKLFMNRQDACSTRKFTFCGTAILPVLENGARSEVSEPQTDNFEILFKQ